VVSGCLGPPRQRLFLTFDVLNRARLAGQAFYNFILLYQSVNTCCRRVWEGGWSVLDAVTWRFRRPGKYIFLSIILRYYLYSEPIDHI